MSRPIVDNWYPQLLKNNLTLAIESDYRPDGITLTGSTVGVQMDNTIRGDNNLIQGTDANRPLFTTNVQNGYPSLLFNGTNNVYTNTTTKTYAWCMAVFNYTKQATFDTGYPVMAGQNSATGTPNKMIMGDGGSGGTLKTLTNSGTMYVNNVQSNDCGPDLTVFKAVYHQATFAYATSGLSVGALSFSVSDYWKGNLLCLYAGPTALTTTERNLFFNFLNNKYNLY
jgi:hypothetical protein